MRNYTSFKLTTSKSGYWKIRAYYKNHVGKNTSEQISVTDANGNLKYDKTSNNKKRANNFFTKFKADYINKKDVQQYKKDHLNFVEEFYRLCPKIDKANAIIRFIEMFIDKRIRAKTCDDVLKTEPFWKIRDDWNAIALRVQGGENIYPDGYSKKKQWNAETHKAYFQSYFKPTCKKMCKRNERYRLNISDVDNLNIVTEDIPPRYLTEEEIAFVESLPPYKDVVNPYPHNKINANKNPDFQMKEAFLFALKTGLRQTDLSFLKWNHIKSEIDSSGKDVYYVSLKTSKSNFKKEVSIPLSPEALDIIGERKNDKDYVFRIPREENVQENRKFAGNRASVLKNYLRTAKNMMKSDIDITPIVFHAARHTFANKFLRASGGNISLTAQCLGHSVATCSKKYARYNENDMIEIANNLDKFDKIKLKRNVLDESQ